MAERLHGSRNTQAASGDSSKERVEVNLIKREKTASEGKKASVESTPHKSTFSG